MNLETLKFRIGITLINGIGNNLAKNLIAYLGNEEAVFCEKPQTLSKIPGISKVLAQSIVQHKHVLERANDEIEFILKNDIQVHYYTDTEYPFRLKECHDAPLLLYTKSKQNLNDAKFIAVVGTRNVTEHGKELCNQLIADLSSVPNIVIISGLAYGVDITAHKAALDANLPTIGVIAHGLDRIYPSQHRSTAVRMMEKGGLVTEYLSNTNPDRQNFVQRNRIIAGLSDAIIVVESAQKGGALITAELANDYNRDVFAFPGRVTDQWSMGCNALIRQNRAALICSGGDVIRMMGWQSEKSGSATIQTQLFHELSPAEQSIYTFLRTLPEGIQVNELAIHLNITYSELTSLLLSMEFKALVKCLPGNIYKASNPA